MISVQSIFVAILVFARTSDLHAELVYGGATELPTILLALIGAAAILAYYGIRELCGVVRELWRRSDTDSEHIIDHQTSTF